jgi:hypothetical protein
MILIIALDVVLLIVALIFGIKWSIEDRKNKHVRT